jgi:hypothetical protein
MPADFRTGVDYTAHIGLDFTSTGGSLIEWTLTFGCSDCTGCAVTTNGWPNEASMVHDSASLGLVVETEFDASTDAGASL